MKCANDLMTDLVVGVLSFVDIFVVAVVFVKPAISTAQPIISLSKTRKQILLLLCGKKSTHSELWRMILPSVDHRNLHTR